MGDLDFDRDELLEQARGNSSAIWHLSARYAREREGSVDGWASYIGAAFAHLDEYGTTVVEIDCTNELVFRTIAEGRGLTFDCHRDGAGLHLVFAR